MREEKHDERSAPTYDADCTGVCCFAAETCPLLPLLYLSGRNFKWIGFGRKRDRRAKIDAREYSRKILDIFTQVNKILSFDLLFYIVTRLCERERERGHTV